VTSSGEAIVFWILGPITVFAALGLIIAKKAVYAALSMALVMVNLGVIYLVLQAHLLGVIQVFVYTGAIMMLFLFVIMLIGVDASDSVVETITGQRVWSLLLGLGLAGILIFPLGGVVFSDAIGLAKPNTDPGNVTGVATLIFGKYVWVFELTSALLITAAMGAMVLAHRERFGDKPNQREWSQRRFRDGRFLAGLPASGVFARHNAVDTPALLPDGSPSQLSVSRVLVARDQITGPDAFTEAEHSIQGEIEEGSAR